MSFWWGKKKEAKRQDLCLLWCKLKKKIELEKKHTCKYTHLCVCVEREREYRKKRPSRHPINKIKTINHSHKWSPIRHSVSNWPNNLINALHKFLKCVTVSNIIASCWMKILLFQVSDLQFFFFFSIEDLQYILLVRKSTFQIVTENSRNKDGTSLMIISQWNGGHSLWKITQSRVWTISNGWLSWLIII